MKMKTNQNFIEWTKTKIKNQKNKDEIYKKTTLIFCMTNMIFKRMIEKSGRRRKKISPLLHHYPSVTTHYPKRKMMTRHFQRHDEGWCLVTSRHYRTSQPLFVFYSYFIFIKISNCPLANLIIIKKKLWMLVYKFSF